MSFIVQLKFWSFLLHTFYINKKVSPQVGKLIFFKSDILVLENISFDLIIIFVFKKEFQRKGYLQILICNIYHLLNENDLTRPYFNTPKTNNFLTRLILFSVYNFAVYSPLSSRPRFKQKSN
jgi:hypothetical protein